jgi:hypothetical protein
VHSHDGTTAEFEAKHNACRGIPMLNTLMQICLQSRPPRHEALWLISFCGWQAKRGAVAELVGIEVGVVSGVINLESSGVEASDWRPRHDEHYHEV